MEGKPRRLQDYMDPHVFDNKLLVYLRGKSHDPPAGGRPGVLVGKDR